MENHLDMHFRQNRKANQNIGRGHSRSWFVGVEVCSNVDCLCFYYRLLTNDILCRTGFMIYLWTLKGRALLMDLDH